MGRTILPSQIFLAEDSPADVRLVREALSEHQVSHELNVFSDGELAMQFIEQLDADSSLRCPDVFLLDLHLPKVDGREILARVQASRCAGTPIVVFSPFGTAMDKQQVFPGVHLFEKPTSLAGFLKLGQLIRSVIEPNEEACENGF